MMGLVGPDPEISSNFAANDDGFNWLAFEGRFFQTKQADDGPAHLFTSIESHAEKVMQEERIKNSLSLKSTLNRIKAIHNRKSRSLHLVTFVWRSDFDGSLRDAGLRVSSVGIHDRNIRTVFNWEISKGRLKQEFYPFGRNRYIPPPRQGSRRP